MSRIKSRVFPPAEVGRGVKTAESEPSHSTWKPNIGARGNLSVGRRYATKSNQGPMRTDSSSSTTNRDIAMADTVPCPSCEFEISKRAKVCPKCGRNTKSLLHSKPAGSKMKDVPQAKGGTPATKQRSTESRRTG
jgi:hypothetical protein